MKLTPSILQNEFIGLYAKVVKSSNPYCVGIYGKVINETKNTFTIKQKDQDKIVVKNISIFHFVLPDKSIIEVDGKILNKQPENRIKKNIRRHW
jgi:ribonuclease P protein subunit POP4